MQGHNATEKCQNAYGYGFREGRKAVLFIRDSFTSPCVENVVTINFSNNVFSKQRKGP